MKTFSIPFSYRTYDSEEIEAETKEKAIENHLYKKSESHEILSTS